MRAFKKVGLSRAIPAGDVVRGDKRKVLGVARVHTDRDSCKGVGSVWEPSLGGRSGGVRSDGCRVVMLRQRLVERAKEVARSRRNDESLLAGR